MIVCKFGGSSLADANQIKKVKAILDADQDRKIVIVSAPGKRFKDDEKVTDMLYECNAMVNRGESCIEKFAQIRERYLEIATELKLNVKNLTAVLDDVRVKIDAGYGKDYTASRGEYLNAILIAEYLGWTFLDASDIIEINQDGTVSDNTWTKLDIRFDQDKRYVIPGFYGCCISGDIRTFSRGGSDITGSILARVSHADLYENWTDVAGIYNADPRYFKGTTPIKHITYKEVRELSGVGASVFHEEAIAPVMKMGIPINVKCTDQPELPGTMISPERHDDVPVVGVSAITPKFSRIVVRKLMLLKKQGVRHALLLMMQVFGVRPMFSMFGVDSINWYFRSDAATEPILKAMCERLKKEFELDEIYVDRDYAIIGIVGQGISPKIGVDCAVALSEADIDVKFMNYGSSDTLMLFGVPYADREKGVQALFDKLFIK